MKNNYLTSNDILNDVLLLSCYSFSTEYVIEIQNKRIDCIQYLNLSIVILYCIVCVYTTVIVTFHRSTLW